MRMKRKIIAAFLTAVLLLFIVFILFNVLKWGKGHGEALSSKEPLKSVAIKISSKLKTASLDSLSYNQKQIMIDNLLAELDIDSLSIDNLSELKWIYWRLFSDPRLDDDVTTGIDRIIKNKINKVVELNVRGKKYPPIEMYILTDMDSYNYQGKLENGCADDSFHLFEFSEACDPISYNELDVFLINLDNDFRFVVEPHIYSGHGGAIKTENWKNHKFNLSSKLPHIILFSIIEEKNATKRKYKVFWSLKYCCRGGVQSK